MAGGRSADTPPSTYRLPSNSEVIGYLLQSVNWYRHVYAERQVANEPADFMFLDDNQAIERQIVKLSFEFAKADAMLVTSAASSHGGTTSTDPPPADLAHFVELKKRNDERSQQAMTKRAFGFHHRRPRAIDTGNERRARSLRDSTPAGGKFQNRD